MKIAIGKQLVIVMFLITISSIQPMTTLPLGSTVILWTIYAFSIFVIIKAIRVTTFLSNADKKNLLFIHLLLLWYLVCIVRGCFVAENYWDLKNLVGNSLILMLPSVAYLALNPQFVSFITHKWLRVVLPFFFIFLPFLVGDGAGRYLVPISILLLFIPLLTNKWKLFLIFFSLFIFLGSLDARSNFVKFGVPLIMGLGLYIGFYRIIAITKALYFIMLFLPIVLFALGLSGTFNIFRLDEIFGESLILENGNEVNLTADTRTMLYEDVIISALNNNYVFWGRTPARGNDTEVFVGLIDSSDFSKINERTSNEVAILNIFTWTGIVGVFLYFLCFAKAAYLAIFRSKNQIARLLGLYVLFRWCYAWVEDFTNFDLSYFYLWVVLGLCYSSQFRGMSNVEVKYWVRGIFDIRYSKVFKKYVDYIRSERGKDRSFDPVKAV